MNPYDNFSGNPDYRNIFETPFTARILARTFVATEPTGTDGPTGQWIYDWEEVLFSDDLDPQVSPCPRSGSYATGGPYLIELNNQETTQEYALIRVRCSFSHITIYEFESSDGVAQLITLTGVVVGSGTGTINTSFSSSTGSGAVVLQTAPTILSPIINPSATNQVGATISGLSGQTANILNVTTFGGTNGMFFDATGALTFGISGFTFS